MTNTRNKLEYLRYGLIAGFVGILLYASQAISLQQFFLASSVALMIASSALATGLFVGFLFGLPRTFQPGILPEKQESNSTEDRQSKPIYGYKVNTNLEEISDWLTKILVGIGLTQIPGILEAFKNYSNYVKENGFDGLKNSSVFAVALLIYFLIYGFLCGYLWTRLVLSSEFSQADQKLIDTVKDVEEIKERSDADARCLRLLSRYLDISLRLSIEQEKELEDKIKKASRTTRFQIFEQAQKVLYDNRLEAPITQNEPLKRLVVKNALKVFEYLRESDENKDNDRYPAHVAYAYMALGDDEEDLKSAISQLEEAKRILKNNTDDENYVDQSMIVYESDQVICRLRLDPDNRLKKTLQALKDLKDKFDGSSHLESLKVFNVAEKVKKLLSKDDDPIKTWADKNKINLSTLTPNQDPPK